MIFLKFLINGITKNNDLDPLKIAPGSPKKVWWKFKKNHSWKASIYRRTVDNNGCKKCLLKLESFFYER